MNEDNLEQFLKEDNNTSSNFQARINPDGSVGDFDPVDGDFTINPKFNSSGRIVEEEKEEDTNKEEMLGEIIIEEKPSSDVVVQSRINPDGSVGDFDPVEGDFTIHAVTGDTGRVIEEEKDEEENTEKEEILEEIVIEEKPVSGVVVQSRINPDGSVREDIALDENTVIHAVVNSTGRVNTNTEEEVNEETNE